MTIQRDGQTTNYFVGREVEKSPAHNLKTLFVIGLQSSEEILELAKERNVKHIYLGANKSFTEDEKWSDLVDVLIHAGYWVTLDYPLNKHEYVMGIINQEMRHSRFIPMISIEIPNIEAYNYNTTIRIDDVDMDYSNPGVWCHRLHDLMDKRLFTQWDEYTNDKQV